MAASLSAFWLWMASSFVLSNSPTASRQLLVRHCCWTAYVLRQLRLPLNSSMPSSATIARTTPSASSPTASVRSTRKTHPGCTLPSHVLSSSTVSVRSSVVVATTIFSPASPPPSQYRLASVEPLDWTGLDGDIGDLGLPIVRSAGGDASMPPTATASSRAGNKAGKTHTSSSVAKVSCPSSSRNEIVNTSLLPATARVRASPLTRQVEAHGCGGARTLHVKGEPSSGFPARETLIVMRPVLPGL